MKTLILTLAAAASLTAAGAARAQTGAPEIDHRQAILAERIDQGVANGRLNRQEAWRARRALNGILQIEHRYMRDGYLSRYERGDLDQRLNDLTNQIRADRADNDGPRDEYGHRYGYNQDRDRYGYNQDRDGRPYDRNGYRPPY